MEKNHALRAKLYPQPFLRESRKTDFRSTLVATDAWRLQEFGLKHSSKWLKNHTWGDYMP